MGIGETIYPLCRCELVIPTAYYRDAGIDRRLLTDYTTTQTTQTLQEKFNTGSYNILFHSESFKMLVMIFSV